MTVLLATDLDRTLIYSSAARALGADDAAAVCVEVHDGKQTSFMTARGGRAFAALTARDGRGAGDHPHPRAVPAGAAARARRRAYAIVANGGVLLVDGEPDRDWPREVARRLAASVPLDEVWHARRPRRAVRSSPTSCATPTGCSATPSCSRRGCRTGSSPTLTAWAAERGWRTSLQGRKLYWVPEQLSKSAAVREVADRVGAATVLAAGDSLLDVDLLLAADRGIHPRHGELHEQGWSAPTVTTTAASGIAAGAEIVEWFGVDRRIRCAGVKSGRTGHSAIVHRT